MNKDFYTVRDIAEGLQVTEKAVRYQIKQGKLISPKFHVVFQSASKFAIPYVLRGIQVVTCAF